MLPVNCLPGEHRKAAKVSKATANANTFEVVARLWFADKSPEWAKSNHSRILRRLESNIFPWLGKKPITEITTPLMLETLKRIADRGYLETAKKPVSHAAKFLSMPSKKGWPW